MATPGIVRIYEFGEPLVAIRRHLDGGPTSFGMEIKNLLKGMKIVNGLTSDMKMFEYANGMGDLAAQLIAELKIDDQILEITTLDDEDADWFYKIYPEKESLGWRETTKAKINVIHEGLVVYDGAVEDWKIIPA